MGEKNLKDKPLFEIDLSSVQRYFEVKNEPSLMEREIRERETVLHCISKLVDRLMEEGGEVFNKLDKSKLIESLFLLVKSISPEALRSISNEELARRIEKIMAIEAMVGLLSDLNPEQIEDFEAALKRRDLLK